MISNIILKKKNIQIIKFIYLMKKADNFHSEFEDNPENWEIIGTVKSAAISIKAVCLYYP